MLNVDVIFAMLQTLALWPVKDCGAAKLFPGIKPDAGDDLRKSLKPLLAKTRVSDWPFFIQHIYSNLI
jgi:hypothetical protein